MKRIGGVGQDNWFPVKQQSKPPSFHNAPGFFPFIMKAFEFYNPPLNQIVMRHRRGDRIKNTINQLYNISTYRCTRCGMRFQHHSALKEHLDYHFQQSVQATERRSGPLTRKPFSTYLNWISDSNIDVINQNHDTMTREQKELENCVPFTTSDGQCFVCGEEFKTVLKDDDEWYFINCKKIQLNKCGIKVHVSNCAKIIEEQVAKFNDQKAKQDKEDEAETSLSDVKK